MEQKLLSKIRLRCRRGMLELDIILQRFLLQYEQQASSEEEKKDLLALLEMPDPQLYQMILGTLAAPQEFKTLVAKILLAQKK